jgi:high-affinity K+ transport system ATPase subunit B
MEVTLIPLTTTGKDLANLATLSSVTDTTALGSAIFSQSLDLARSFSIPKGSRLILPSESDELSGVDLKTRKIRKGTHAEIQNWRGRSIGEETIKIVNEIESRGNRAFVIADEEQEIGVIEVRDLAGMFLGRQTDTSTPSSTASELK